MECSWLKIVVFFSIELVISKIKNRRIKIFYFLYCWPLAIATPWRWIHNKLYAHICDHRTSDAKQDSVGLTLVALVFCPPEDIFCYFCSIIELVNFNLLILIQNCLVLPLWFLSTFIDILYIFFSCLSCPFFSFGWLYLCALHLVALKFSS